MDNEQNVHMLNLKKEYEILGKAITAFQEATNLKLEMTDVKAVFDRPVDAVLRVTVGDKQFNLMAEVKATITETTIGRLAQDYKTLPANWVIVTRYVYPALARRLHEINIQFIDTVGNTFLNMPQLMILIRGNYAKREITRDQGEKIFRRAGLKLIFALLGNGKLHATNFREIADIANVAIGTVNAVFLDLTKNGYLVDFGHGRRKIIKRKLLFEKWIAGYAERMRRGLLIGRYHTNLDNFRWRDFALPENTRWGGETAAAQLTNYIKPEIITLYTNRPVNELIRQLKLTQDDNGTIELREQFWHNDNQWERTDVVHPILIYADLLATGDRRNIETAQIIYDDYIKRYIEQD